MDARMLYLHALSPIHCGTGQAAATVDLPVAREKLLGWPYLPASSIKGVLRDTCAAGSGPAQADLFRLAFGPDTAHADEGAGALWFADGHLLCLPVRSYYGSFAWVTCPLALRRWQRDYRASGLALTDDRRPMTGDRPPLDIPALPAEMAILVARDDVPIASGGQVYLEDLDLSRQVSSEASAIARRIASAVFSDQSWQEEFQGRFGIVRDDLFTFLAEASTEVVARVKLRDDSKTVQKGGLWYEEAVPAESIFSCPVLASARDSASGQALYGILAPHLNKLLQIGGSASVGRGLVEMRLEEVRS